MLRLLRIRNFAIIDELELEFHNGFNAITGETGAGKSIILDAVSLILGSRANTDVIRNGSDEATVEALFDIGQNETFDTRLQSLGCKGSNSETEIIIKRTIHRSGKNKIFFNGELITVTMLGEICESLVDLCSQHEHQSLSKSSFQLDLLDRYGGLLGKRRELRELFSALRSCETELSALFGNDAERERTKDFLKFQINEIDEFGPTRDEELNLISERRKLLNSTHLLEAVDQCLGQLSESESSNSSARALLSRSSQKLSKALAIDENLFDAAQALERASLELDEAISLLSSYATGLEVEPNRLELIEERLSQWSEIKRKYGGTFDAIVESRQRLQNEFDEFEHRQEKISILESKKFELEKEYSRLAKDLSKKRKNVAATLKESIQNELRELMMPGTQFEIEVTPSENNRGPEGIDRIQFLFSPNPGEGLKPVAKIASGGEMSRVMLAIRRTIADRGGIGVYVFDEIDSGIGGQTASIVGKKLKSVSVYNQVICITHLPQVAAYADSHFSVTKKVIQGRTLSSILKIDGSKRIDELARMLGGLNLTDKSRAHAKDLLKQANSNI